MPRTLDQTHAPQPLPRGARGNPTDVRGDPVAAELQPPVTLVCLLVEVVSHARKAARLGVEQEVTDLLVQEWVVALEGEHVVRVGFPDLAGGVFLRVERVHDHDAPGQLQLAGKPVEDVAVNHCHLSIAGGGTAQQDAATIKGNPGTYPVPGMFGPMYHACGFYVQHARNVQFSNVAVVPLKPDARPLVAVGPDVENGLLDGKPLLPNSPISGI